MADLGTSSLYVKYSDEKTPPPIRANFFLLVAYSLTW